MDLSRLVDKEIMCFLDDLIGRLIIGNCLFKLNIMCVLKHPLI